VFGDAEDAEYLVVMGLDAGEQDCDVASFQPGDGIAKDFRAGCVEGNDPGQSQDHDLDIGDRILFFRNHRGKPAAVTVWVCEGSTSSAKT
jgi:hypothetical protein